MAALLASGCADRPGSAPTTSTTEDSAATADPAPSAPNSESTAASGAGSSPVDATTPSPPPPIVAPFDTSAAMAFATSLAADGPRHAGTPGDERGRRRIAAAVLGTGWHLLRQPVDLPQGGTTENLLAVRDPGDLDRPHVVVGGHHDTIGDSPGANDNASGIGVLVALLRELDDEADLLPVPVVVAAFGAEEFQPATPRAHHLGSEAYAREHGEHVVGALVVDMVGNGSTTCACWFDRGPRTMADRLLAVARAADLPEPRIRALGDISDHGPFARRRLPAAFLWSGPDDRKHTPRDTAEHLRPEDVGRAGALALAFVRTLGAQDREGLRPSPTPS